MEVEPNMVFDNVNVNRSLASTVISLALLARKGWQELNIFNFAEKRLSFNRNIPEDPDCWLITIILKITFFSIQVLDHKEVLTLAPRQETNLANDLLEKTSVKTIDHSNAHWTWTWRWRLCIWEGWWWRRCIPTKGPCCQPPEPPWLRTIEIWFSFCSDFSLTLLTLDCKTDHIPLKQNMVLKRLLLIFEVKKTSRAKPT